MTIRLRFVSPTTPTPGPVRLRFGEGGIPVVTGALSAALAVPAVPLSLQGQGATRWLTGGTLSAALPVPALGLSLHASGRIGPRTLAGVLASTLPLPAVAISLQAHASQILPAVFTASLPLIPPGGLLLQGQGAPILPAHATAMLAVAPVGLALTATAHRDDNLPTDSAHAVDARQQHARPGAAATAARHQHGRPASRACHAGQRHGLPLGQGLTSAQRHMLTRGTGVGTQQHHGTPLGAGLATALADTLRVSLRAGIAQQQGLPLGIGASTWLADTLRLHAQLATGQQQGRALGHLTVAQGRHGRPLITCRILRQQHGEWPRPGYWRPPVIDPETPVDPLIRLRFARPADSTRPHTLIFGYHPAPTPAGPVVVPVQESYSVLSTASLVRADTGQPIPFESLTASLDADGWTWNWSADGIPASALALVHAPGVGEYAEVLATWNNITLRLVVEKITRRRQFPTAMLAIGGRGRAAWLADPASPVITRSNPAPRTAYQLMAEALTHNGVAMGWDIDWRITDWLVPAGAWSHTGSYQAAVTRIAEAGGAYVQPHDTHQTLIVQPYYPLPPWLWHTLTPDLVLPEDVCETEDIEQIDRATYNAVWIVGTEHGRADRVLRTGTAGDQVAPTVVDPLATAPEMTRQRGRRILSDTGRQQHIKITLPVLEQTGIIKPGLLIDYTEQGVTHRGITRAVEVTAAPVVQQTITLETHLEAAA